MTSSTSHYAMPLVMISLLPASFSQVNESHAAEKVSKPWHRTQGIDDSTMVQVLTASHIYTTTQCNPGYEMWNFTEQEIAAYGGFERLGIRPRSVTDYGRVRVNAEFDRSVAIASSDGTYYASAWNPDNSTPSGDTILQFFYQQCRRCRAGSFSVDGHPCIPCPIAATCYMTLFNQTAHNLFTKTDSFAGTSKPQYLAGFWTAAREDVDFLHPQTSAGIACTFPFSKRCPGGSTCTENYDNDSYMCGACANTSAWFGAECHSCASLWDFPSVNVWWLLVVVVVSRLAITAQDACIRRNEKFGNFFDAIRSGVDSDKEMSPKQIKSGPQSRTDGSQSNSSDLAGPRSTHQQSPNSGAASLATGNREVSLQQGNMPDTFPKQEDSIRLFRLHALRQIW